MEPGHLPDPYAGILGVFPDLVERYSFGLENEPVILRLDGADRPEDLRDALGVDGAEAQQVDVLDRPMRLLAPHVEQGGTSENEAIRVPTCLRQLRAAPGAASGASGAAALPALLTCSSTITALPCVGAV